MYELFFNLYILWLYIFLHFHTWMILLSNIKYLHNHIMCVFCIHLQSNFFCIYIYKLWLTQLFCHLSLLMFTFYIIILCVYYNFITVTYIPTQKVIYVFHTNFNDSIRIQLHSCERWGHSVPHPPPSIPQEPICPMLIDSFR